MKKQKMYEILMEAIQENSLQMLQDRTEEILRLPFVVCDNNYNVIMQVPEKYYDDELWDSMLNYKVVIPEMVQLIQKDKYQESLDDHDNLLYIDYGIGTTLPRIVSTIHFEEKIVGYICVLLSNKTMSDEQYEKVDIITKFFSIYLSKHIAPSIPNHDFYFYLQHLFTAERTSSSFIKKPTITQSIPLTPNFVIAYTKVFDKSNEIVYLYQLFNHVNKQNDIYPILDEHHLFMLFNNVHEDLKGFISVQLENIISSTKVTNLQFGVSEAFHTMDDVTKYKHQAIQAYAFRDSQPFHFFQDGLLDDLFKQVLKQDKYALYAHSAMDKLKVYDDVHHSTYLDTLKVFLKQFCSSSDACKVLNIHRNSLLYRLDKIQEIGEFSLKDKLTCIQLLCNFYMYRDEGH